MRTLAAIALAAAVAAVSMVSGCKSDGGNGYYTTPTNTVVNQGFADETYVWEGFIFSTNRVEGAK